MKKIVSTIAMLLCMSFLMMVLSGSDCKKKSTTEPGTPSLVGTWVLTGGTMAGVPITPQSAGMQQTLVINQNGTYTLTEITQAGTIVRNGTWTATATQITITENGETTTMTYNITGNKLTLNMIIEMDIDGDGTKDQVPVAAEYTKQ